MLRSNLCRGSRILARLTTTPRTYTSAATAAAANRGHIIKTYFNRDSTTITFSMEESSKPVSVCFNNVFLRDASHSAKLVTTGELYHNEKLTAPQDIQISEDGKSLVVKWKDGGHHQFPLQFFIDYKGSSFVSPATRKQESRYRPQLWNKRILKDNVKDLLSVSYNEFIDPKDDSKLFQTLVNLQKFGIAFISGTPSSSSEGLTIQKICERIGPIRSTVHGEGTFDVNASQATSVNAHYANKDLPLHTDLPFLENVPGFQILQSLPATEGEDPNTKPMNYFVDAFYATRNVRESDFEAYEALQIVPVNYIYENGDKRYYQSKPLIEHHDINEDNTLLGNYEALIKCINYSPPYQAPFTFGIYDKPSDLNNNPDLNLITTPAKLTERFLFKSFIRGLNLFESHINDFNNQFRLQLPENCCVIFNNRRILHANSLTSSNQQWLKGCYFDSDTFKSKLKFLEEKFPHDK
ncbi:Aim17p [Saccharomyces cerevisiae]|uniref:YHL021C-like protein n=1 Tax=Saccharomyces cerevisiae x Saccharomyces kudriavzevii (strain VIN7) TaxID=1095631 RepID=H0GH97_SACCK|nr:Aim17p [Saccharomyces cerevisiae YJM270]EHN06829.1 YHL021C-like protein [Saccharomyces cerevisiae x Saccharomyces kudriavzevii VIN7]PTN15630.1 Aim17p [Saccharomyces cerevisiae]PTN23665.1 Aim17p [Saccharomyces cerevisiae]PTN29382.1 Aim17p [Saccharomyces cerevisiae]